MTTTVPAQSTQDDLRIVASPPTVEQGMLVAQLMQTDAMNGANKGWQHLRAFEKPPTLAQLRKRHEPGSTEYGQVMAFMASCETYGTFVKQGILNEALIDDLFWTAGAWRATEKICKGIRKEAGEPRLFENFERLASRAS